MTTLDDLITPALLIDVDALDRNIARMAAWADGHVQLRPHVKTLKSPDVAKRQVAAGAIGVTAATVEEALAMAAAGIPEILIANEIVQRPELARLLAGGAGARIILCVDTEAGASLIAEAARAAGTVVDVVLEIDVGMHRGGARTVEEAVALAGVVDSLDGIRLVGVMGYEGHTVLEPDDAKRAANAVAAMDSLGTFVDALTAAGHTIDIVAAAGTNTHATTGHHPVVTELQVGTYGTMDVSYLPFVNSTRPDDPYEVAMSILATVSSVHGNRVVLDAGTKAFGPARLTVPRAHTPGWTVAAVHEEHVLVDIDEGTPVPQVGDHGRFDVAYAGGPPLLFGQYTVVRGDDVIETWPIVGGAMTRGVRIG